MEQELIEKLGELKYMLRCEISDRASLEHGFCQYFEAFNRVSFPNSEFQRLQEEIVTPDVFNAAQTSRHRKALTCDDGKPLECSLLDTSELCVNAYVSNIVTVFSHMMPTRRLDRVHEKSELESS